MKKLSSREILLKYTKQGIEDLNKIGNTIGEELRQVKWQDIKALTKQEFNKISLPLLYDWSHITANYDCQEEITKLSNKYKSVSERLFLVRHSKLYNEQLENILKTIIQKQKASISMLQRLFEIDFPKAESYIKELELLGVIEKQDKYYKVLISKYLFKKYGGEI